MLRLLINALEIDLQFYFFITEAFWYQTGVFFGRRLSYSNQLSSVLDAINFKRHYLNLRARLNWIFLHKEFKSLKNWNSICRQNKKKQIKHSKSTTITKITQFFLIVWLSGFWNMSANIRKFLQKTKKILHNRNLWSLCTSCWDTILYLAKNFRLNVFKIPIDKSNCLVGNREEKVMMRLKIKMKLTAIRKIISI